MQYLLKIHCFWVNLHFSPFDYFLNFSSLKESNVPRKQQLPYTINWNDFNAFFSYKKVAKLPLNYIFNTKGSFFMLCAPINSFIKWILCLLYLHRGIKESCISKRIVLTQHFLSIFFSRLSTKYLYDSPYIILSLVLYIRYITI